ALKKSHVIHQITEVERAESALKLLEDDISRFNIAVIDYQLPGMNGMELCSVIRRRHLPLPLVMQTGTGSEQLAVIALKSGVDDYIVKDSDHNYLRSLPACLSRVVQNHSHRLARQRAENALRASEAKYRSLIDAAMEGVWVIDPEARTSLINGSMANMLGYTVEEMIGRPIFQFIPGFDRADAERYLARLRQGRTCRQDFSFQRRDGSTLWSIVSATPIFSENGWFDGTLVMVTDISNLKLTEEVLQNKDAALRARDEFLTNLNHEFRTPLNGIIGMATLTMETDLDPTQREYLEIIKSSADSLLALFSDLLEFSNIESGKIDPAPKPFHFHNLIATWRNAADIPARQKGLDLVFDIQPGVPDKLVGDYHRLEQVIRILVENAVKFTDHGKVVLSVKVTSYQANKINLLFTVSDTGMGIAQDKLETIFVPFIQSDSSYTRKHGGLGVGLSLASRLAMLMGGRIWAESRQGLGSTFYFSVSLDRSEKGTTAGIAPEPTSPENKGTFPAAPPALDNQSKLHILLAEDNPVNQQLVVLLLKRQGHTVKLAQNGTEALAVLDKEHLNLVPAGPPIDLVLMDIQMPELNGLETTRIIREREGRIGGHLPIIALTAHNTNDDREQCQDAGMDGFVPKPINTRELFRVMAEVIPAATKPKTKHEPADIIHEISRGTPTGNCPVHDQKSFITRVCGQPQFAREVIEVFLKEMPENLADILQAVNRGDTSELQQKAHRIKGMLGNVSAIASHKAARRLEDMARQGDLTQAEEAFAALEKELGRLVQVLNEFLRQECPLEGSDGERS
ncbi:MAG: response regulator, partial [Deltaproteobacteria bacterium]|nr:response regulator [Deltaproteobacteria bacterium]